MNLSSTPIVLPILIIIFMITFSPGRSLLIATDPLDHPNCSDFYGHYTKPSLFWSVLKNATAEVVLNAPSNDGFLTANKSIPHHEYVYALAQCRGGINKTDCSTCLKKANTTITSKCNTKLAIVWEDLCFLKYSSEEFFDTVDFYFTFTTNGKKTTRDTKKFPEAVRGLLGNLSRTAVTTNRAELFASGSLMYKRKYCINGKVQCSRDLSAGKCGMCLTDVVGHLPGFNNSASPLSGAAFYGSCYVTYEVTTICDN